MLLHFYPASFLQLFGALQHNEITGCNSLFNGYVVSFAGPELNPTHRYGLVLLYEIDEGPLGAALNGSGRDYRHAAQSVHKKAGIDELVGKKSKVFIVKHGFEPVCPGGGIDLVVGRQQMPRGNFSCLCTIVSFYLQGFSGS